MEDKGQITKHEWEKVAGFGEHCPHCKTDMYWSFEHKCYRYHQNGNVLTECPACITRPGKEAGKS